MFIFKGTTNKLNSVKQLVAKYDEKGQEVQVLTVSTKHVNNFVDISQ